MLLMLKNHINFLTLSSAAVLCPPSVLDITFLVPASFKHYNIFQPVCLIFTKTEV